MSRRRCSVQEFAAMVQSKLGRLEADRGEFTKIASDNGVMIPFRFDISTKVIGKKAMYRVPVSNFPVRTLPTVTEAPMPMTANVATLAVDNVSKFPEEKMMTNSVAYLPQHDETFVEWGNFNDIFQIVSQGCFYPIYVTGLSGNGKTMNIEEACYKAKREFIRANITTETDEDDLIGGFRLINGDTVWQDGPVVEAMTRGAILLLDEVDLASTKIMCMQPVLEGKGIFVKKISRWVRPSPGFNIFATANTKGKGSDTGHFVGTSVLNEAFLDRFAATLFQGYPPKQIEVKILLEACVANFTGKPVSGVTDENTIGKLIDNLVNWAGAIRETYATGGINEVISTRRLVNIIKAYFIFQSEEKAMKMSLERFDDATVSAMLELYNIQKKK